MSGFGVRADVRPQVKVPVENMLGKENEGIKVICAYLKFAG